MATPEYLPLIVALLFLLVNVAILVVILALNRHQSAMPAAPPIPPGEPLIDPSDILGWEFEYARVTASEAMRERHTMVNFYLLVAGIITSGVAALLSARQRPAQRTWRCTVLDIGGDRVDLLSGHHPVAPGLVRQCESHEPHQGIQHRARKLDRSSDVAHGVFVAALYAAPARKTMDDILLCRHAHWSSRQRSVRGRRRTAQPGSSSR